MGNIITGSFTEKVIELAVPSPEDIREKRLKEDVANMALLKKAFREADKDGSDQLAEDELHGFLQGKCAGTLQKMGIEVKDFDTFRRLITKQGHSHAIELNNFVSTCMQLKGEAMCVDLYSSELRIGSLITQQEKGVQCCLNRLRRI